MAMGAKDKSEKVRVTLEPTLGGGAEAIAFRIAVLDRSLLGRKATFTIWQHVKVTDAKPVHAKKELFATTLRLEQPETRVDIPRDRLRVYSYHGKKVRVLIETRLTVDDAFFFDTTVTEAQEIQMRLKPAVRDNDPNRVMNPPDVYDMKRCFHALPFIRKLRIACLGVLTAVLTLGTLVAGCHDQWVPEGQEYAFSHRNSDGEPQYPWAMGALSACAVLVVGGWLMRRELRFYITIRLKRPPLPIRRDTVLKVSDLVAGKCHTELDGALLRIVACNAECGAYERQQGTSTTTIYFRNPLRAVILYSRRFPLIPKGMRLEKLLTDTIAFEPMFAALYPPNMASKTHGFSVDWEVQLLHDDLMDWELKGNASVFEYDDFMKA